MPAKHDIIETIRYNENIPVSRLQSKTVNAAAITAAGTDVMIPGMSQAVSAPVYVNDEGRSTDCISRQPASCGRTDSR